MDISLYFAKAIGLYLFVVGLVLLLNAKRVKPLIMDLFKSPPLLFVGGFVALILGTFIVSAHNIWEADWKIIITLVGWAALIKGTVLVLFPQPLVTLSQKWVKNNVTYYATGIFVLLMGLYLISIGYL